MATVTATPDPTTGTVLVQVEATILRDLFTRVVANSWGSATTGQAYTHFGPAAGFAVNGSVGQHSHSAANTGRISVADIGVTSGRFKGEVTIPALASGAALIAFIVMRFTNDNNYYMARIGWTLGNTVTVTLRKRVLAVETNLASDTVPGLVATAGVPYAVELEVMCNTLRARVWVPSVSGPPDWQVVANDFDLTSGTFGGARSVLDVGSTNVTPFVYAFDNFAASWGQQLRLYRVTPDGVETEVLGSPFNTNEATAAANTATATLWDNTSPLDTDVFYRVRNQCGDLVGTSNTVQLDSMDGGWLRDPLNPTKNLRIEFGGFFDPCVDQDWIEFSGLGNPSYENASGIYPIIDARRPRVVSQTRKNYASSLALTSFSLDDTISLEDLYDPGTILSLSLPTSYGWALRTFGTDYIAIGTIQQAYIGVDQEVTARSWTMPFWLTGPPADPTGNGNGGNGVGGGGATYDDLAASALGTTYNSLTASGLTYDQIAAGTGY